MSPHGTTWWPWHTPILKAPIVTTLVSGRPISCSRTRPRRTQRFHHLLSSPPSAQCGVRARCQRITPTSSKSPAVACTLGASARRASSCSLLQRFPVQMMWLILPGSCGWRSTRQHSSSSSSSSSSSGVNKQHAIRPQPATPLPTHTVCAPGSPPAHRARPAVTAAIKQASNYRTRIFLNFSGISNTRWGMCKSPNTNTSCAHRDATHNTPTTTRQGSTAFHPARHVSDNAIQKADNRQDDVLADSPAQCGRRPTPTLGQLTRTSVARVVRPSGTSPNDACNATCMHINSTVNRSAKSASES